MMRERRCSDKYTHKDTFKWFGHVERNESRLSKRINKATNWPDYIRPVSSRSRRTKLRSLKIQVKSIRNLQLRSTTHFTFQCWTQISLRRWQKDVHMSGSQPVKGYCICLFRGVNAGSICMYICVICLLQVSYI